MRCGFIGAVGFISLLLCAGGVLAWVYGYPPHFPPSLIFYQRDAGQLRTTAWAASIRFGDLKFWRVRRTYHEAAAFDNADRSPGFILSPGWNFVDHDFTVNGERTNNFYYGSSHSDFVSCGQDAAGLGIPMWLIVPITSLIAVLCAFQLILAYRRARRRKIGYCARCGYDLRASKERCPECGASH